VLGSEKEQAETRETKKDNSQTLYPMDLKSTSSCYEVWLNVPGYNLAGIEITYKDKYLEIKGLYSTYSKGSGLAISEKPEDPKFSRIVKLNTPVNMSAMFKEVRDGILYLRIPKTLII
jgi:HSP20 family molecular chaperone IbpA